jgi:uncharacterized protein (DUF2252 family)
MNWAHSIGRATRDYEAWLASRVRVVKADLRAKHRLMTEDAFFVSVRHVLSLDAVVPRAVPETRRRAKGFGRWRFARRELRYWRDAEGRLVWDINDFDEACPLHYTNDLVRLATSAWLAIEADESRASSGGRLHDDPGRLHRRA